MHGDLRLATIAPSIERPSLLQQRATTPHAYFTTGRPPEPRWAIEFYVWYWNQSNFEGLLAVADSISAEPLWCAFADYCTLREKGLRKQALASIERLINQSADWSAYERRRFVNWIYETHLRFPDVHQLIVTPLNQRLLIPALATWIEDDPANAIPRRWLGFATGDHAHFADALSRDPKDDVSRYRLVCRKLGDVDFQCHHLPVYFIDDPTDALKLLDDARDLSAGFCDPRIVPSLKDEFATLNGKVNDWIAFQKTGGNSFSEWCEDNGRKYEWVMTFYYNK